VRYGDTIYNQGITNGDFNGDGNPDLAVINYGDSQVRILFGRGDGTFGSQEQVIPCGPSPQYIASGDFNGDGRLDLVIANNSASYLTVLLGDGTGAFPTRHDVPCDDNPNFVAVVDLFGDGHPAILSTHGNANTLDIFRGNPDGTFQAPIVLATDAAPIAVAARDLNGDGKIDVAVVNNSANNIQVFPGQGGGVFAAPVVYATDFGPHDVVFADFNQDGRADMAVCNQYSGDVAVYPGLAGGAFADPYTFAVGSNTNSLVVGDFNGDGRPDLVAGNFGSDNVSVLLNDGDLPPVSGNQPPVLAPIGNKTVDELTQLRFTASATDPDLPAQALTFSLVNAPAGASIVANTGAFTWTPTEAQGPGAYTFTVRVTDNGTPNLSDEEAITVTVNEVNTAPVLASIGNRIVSEGALLTFTARATDADLPANVLTFSLANAPTGASINATTGVFNWTPSHTQAGHSYSFTVRVADNGTPSFSDEESITVAVNALPTSTISSAPFVSGAATFPVAWTGSSPGSTIAFYDIYASVDGRAYTRWLAHTTATSANYPGAAGHTYRFYSVATDAANGVQPTPTGPQATTVVTGLTALTLRRSGVNVQAVSSLTNAVLNSRPISDPAPLFVLGSATLADTLTVNFAAGGEFALAGGIRFDGGSGAGDRFALVGAGTSTATLTPGSTRAYAVAGNAITLAGVESDVVTGVQGLTVATTGGNDIFTIDRPVAGQNRLYGTGIPLLTFLNLRDLTIDLGAGDTAASSNALTVLTGWGAAGLKNVTITGGPGSDTLTHSGSLPTLPVAGGTYRFDGGGGTDTVAASANAGWALSDASLTSTLGGQLNLSGVEQARLTGGAGNNVFTVSGWSGQATIDGGAGLDTLVSANDADLTLTANTLTRSTGGSFTFTGIEYAMLTGGAGNNTLDATGFAGTLLLGGGAGDDTLRGGAGPSILLGGPGADVLTAGMGRAVLIGGAGGDTLTGGANDDLLIHGTTAYDATAGALFALLAEWGRPDRTYAQRIADLRNGAGLNGPYRLTAATVPDDLFADTLEGGAGNDWFWAKLPPGVADTLLDRRPGEAVN
jgi:Ca2+-binding RTX toxin-like protein